MIISVPHVDTVISYVLASCRDSGQQYALSKGVDSVPHVDIVINSVPYVDTVISYVLASCRDSGQQYALSKVVDSVPHVDTVIRCERYIGISDQECAFIS